MSRSLEVTTTVTININGDENEKKGRLLLPLSEKMEGQYLEIRDIVLDRSSGLLVPRGTTQFVFQQVTEDILRLLEERRKLEDELRKILRKE